MTSVFKTFLYFVFIFVNVFCEYEKIVDPCGVNDLECIKKSSRQFAQQTYKGIPDYDVKTTDPLIIPTLDYRITDLGIVYHLKNVNLTGLKTQKLADVMMNTTAKSVVVTTQADLEVVADVVIKIIRTSKQFSGTYTAKATAAGTAEYYYEITKDSKGIEHFDIGPEVTSCKIMSDLRHATNTEPALENDPDNRELAQMFRIRKAEFERIIFCKIVEEAYHTVVHNIRASAKVLPKDAFFKDI